MITFQGYSRLRCVRLRRSRSGFEAIWRGSSVRNAGAGTNSITRLSAAIRAGPSSTRNPEECAVCPELWTYSGRNRWVLSTWDRPIAIPIQHAAKRTNNQRPVNAFFRLTTPPRGLSQLNLRRFCQIGCSIFGVRCPKTRFGRTDESLNVISPELWHESVVSLTLQGCRQSFSC